VISKWCGRSACGPALTVDTSIRNLTNKPLTWAMDEHPCSIRKAVADGVIAEGDGPIAWQIGFPFAANGRSRRTIASTCSGSVRFAHPDRRVLVSILSFYPFPPIWEDYTAGSGRGVVAVEPATVPGRTTTDHTEAASRRELDPGQLVCNGGSADTAVSRIRVSRPRAQSCDGALKAAHQSPGYRLESCMSDQSDKEQT
jgi:hypothetical protein